MENATKALIMSATILISIAIVSLGVYLAASLSSYSSQVDEETRRNQIAQFNAQFTQYQGNEVTIYDIISLANLAKENNDSYELGVSNAGRADTVYVTINVAGIGNGFEISASAFSTDKEKMAKQYDENGNLKKYTCTQVLVSDITQRVYQVTFQEIKN